ncbi:MAG: Parallel beta-helix repeat protein [Bacteroidetes bacterium]|nr:Parallel beta-helix repeat protein [Bacteroidota bacterium]
MKKTLITIILSLFLINTFASSGSVTFYVSPKGNDTNPGSIDKPFESIQRARKAVSETLKTKNDTKVTVLFRQGSYRIDKSIELGITDSGNENHPVIFGAYPDEAVSFTGGISIPVKKARNISDKNILNRLVPEVRGKILQVDLKALGIKNYGTLTPRGFGRPYQSAPMELFCNQTAMKLSRWPNDSLTRIIKVLDKGSIPRNDDFSKRGGKFTYNVDRPDRWKSAKEVWISGFFKYGYADDAVKVANIDFTNKTITTLQPTMYGFDSGKEFHRWYAYNLLEEIDQPGEYFIDREQGKLYFFPPEGGLNSVELSILEEPMVVIENGSNIYFRNITFECSRGMGIYIEKGNNNRIENCTFRNLGQVGICVGKGVAPFDDLRHAGTGKPTSRVLGSILAHFYNNTTFNREAGKGHVISGCHIYNTGTGGISMGGGDRLSLESGNNVVENCRIHDFNRLDRSYKVGINIDGVGNIIRHNEIYNCPGSAILLHGNNHLIEYNNIHHAVTDGDDMGAIYYGRDPSEFGNKVQYNFFHHIGNDHGVIMAVYHDDGACGMQVTGNVFYKAGSKTVMIGGGNDNTYKYNIFIDQKLAFHLDNRLMRWAKNLIEEGGIYQKRLQAVNYKNPPYSIAYPSLVNYFEDNVGMPKRNYIQDNIFVNVQMISNGGAEWSGAEWSNVGRNYHTCDTSIFVDFEKMNFELKPNAEVFKLIPKFKAVPFNKIGIQGTK